MITAIYCNRKNRRKRGNAENREDATINAPTTIITDDIDFVVTYTIIASNVARSVAFCRDVLEATVVREGTHEGEPTFFRLGNLWLTANLGRGEPTDDKPAVAVSPQTQPNVLNTFLNLRVREIAECYRLWSSRGAKFLTEPKVHAMEIRCYMNDPDGYLIEVGQTTMTATPFDAYK